MSEQLIKKNQAGGYNNVMPNSWIESIRDKSTGQTLKEILQGFNMYFLPYNGNASETRCLVPMILRKKGLWITYVKYDGNVYTEWYAADSIENTAWGDSSNWRIGNNTLVGDITISANGNWVINGTETEFKAVGEKGNTPLIRVANNRFQVSYDLGDTYMNVTENPVYTQFRNHNNKIQVSTDLGATWTDASDEIAAYFRWQATSGDTQANNVGRVQISRDNETWVNLSNDIVNNLHISRYIGVNESLPTSGIAEGTIYAKGPYYAEDDTLNNNPIYRLWVYAWKGSTLAWQDNGEFTSIAAGVVQETGDSETQVMSQKATTEKLTELAQDINELPHTQDGEGADLRFADELGNVLLKLKDGHIETKEFDSKEITMELDVLSYISSCDFLLCDDNNNVLLKLKDGHIQTKEFNSKEVGDKTKFPSLEHFKFDTALLPMEDELKDFKAKEIDEIGCATFPLQIISKMDKLVFECPSLVEKIDAATFAELEYPVYAKLEGVSKDNYLATPSYTIPIYHFIDNSVNNGKKQKVLIVAGVHGWENASQFNCFVFLSKLCNCSSTDYMALRHSIDLWIIPCVNMYGAFHGVNSSGESRKNANKIDINRNFPVSDWKVIGDIDDITYSGQSPASEFETKLIINCTKRIVPDILIDHHSYGSFVNYNFFQSYSDLLGQTIGYQNLYAWTAQGCLSYPEHYGTHCYVKPTDMSISKGQYLDYWAKESGVASSATIEVSIGIGFKNGEKYETHSEYLEADTEWKVPSIQMNELALRLSVMKYVYYHLINNINTLKIK